MTRPRKDTKDTDDAILKHREYARNYYHANKDKCRSAHRKYLYKITENDYYRFIEEQKGLCAICGGLPQPRKGHKTALMPDHNHETGQVRALLCHRCNIMLGKIEKNPGLAQKMIAYLQYKQN